MDEPLSNLDALLRLEMRAELKTLLQSLDATTIYVTHDQIEALSMGDRIAVMNKGQIVQLGNPLEVYDNPADTFVGGFIGNPPMNFLEASVSANGERSTATVSGGSIQLSGETAALAGHELLLGIRAEAIGVETSPADGLVRARVVVLEPLGSHNLLTVRCGDDVLKVSVRPDLFPTAGQRRLAAPRAVANSLDGPRDGSRDQHRLGGPRDRDSRRHLVTAHASVRASVIVDPHFRAMEEIFSPEQLARLRGLVDVVWARDEPMPDEDFRRALPDATAIVSGGWRYGDVLGEAASLRAILTVSGGWPPELDYAGVLRARDPRPLGRACVRRRCGGDGDRPRARLQPRRRDRRPGDASRGRALARRRVRRQLLLAGKRVGFVGYGNIGRRLHELLRPFRLRGLPSTIRG